MGKYADLTGQRFERLEVLKDSGERTYGKVLWLCICDCGNTCKVQTSYLKTGNTKSCGCLARQYRSEWGRSQKKDLTDQRFGRLVVLKDSGERAYGNVLWLCACDCGNTCKVRTSHLTAGGVRSCGCLVGKYKAKRGRSQKIELIGQRFGRLVVLKDSGERAKGRVLWLCACDCGNTCKVQGHNLKTGNTKSCGCLASQHIARLGRSSLKDLTGQRFGRLVVLKDSGERARRNVVWLCTCDCGKFCKVPTDRLKTGNTKSCGCLASQYKAEWGHSRVKDLTGQRFGRLVVLRDSGERTWGRVLWHCACDCGNTCKVHTHNLKTGNTKSCGCARRNSGGT